ncbi:Uncharacterized protein dnm_001450 [Desulfonema magnum]|uniref:Uncharacterized protein n=1 Tax=Desulfonema magnum TaxID=45655 RepID=A0A975BEY4_9BACT|nr:Uncharacterized protein dnm_001450 [Desulfonema magnum]
MNNYFYGLSGYYKFRCLFGYPACITSLNFLLIFMRKPCSPPAPSFS